MVALCCTSRSRPVPEEREGGDLLVRQGPQGLGEMPDEVEGEIPVYEKMDSKPRYGAGEIWFEGMSKAAMWSAVARLHINLHHPPRSDLVRLVMHGGRRVAIRAGTALRCATCGGGGGQKTGRARPASLPKFGQFNGIMVLDVVYCQDAKGNH